MAQRDGQHLDVRFAHPDHAVDVPSYCREISMAQAYRLGPPGGSAAEEEVCKTVQRWSCRLGVACGNREELSDAANRNGTDIVAATFHERELWPDSLDQLVASRFGSIRVQRHCNRQSQMRGEVAANEGSA